MYRHIRQGTEVAGRKVGGAGVGAGEEFLFLPDALILEGGTTDAGIDGDHCGVQAAFPIRRG